MKPATLTPKQRFIRQLAEFLVKDQEKKSIQLQVEAARNLSDFRPCFAQEWAALRTTTPIFGYQTVDEAVEQLTEFLK